MKKIVLLFNLKRNQFEYEAEFDSEQTVNRIEQALRHEFAVIPIEAKRDFKWIQEIVLIKPDLVFNICEGFNGPARESVYAALLEQLNINYSGPDSTNLLICHNKFLVKKLLNGYVQTPDGFVINNKTELKKTKDMVFPLIVKLNSEGSSIGMNANSIVYDFGSLEKQVDMLLQTYKRTILVEEYIAGQDLSMVYVEGIGAMGPCIVKCPSVFYDYEMKSTKDELVEIIEANGNFEILKEIVSKIVRRLDVKGYAKMDFRFSMGKYYLIEVNAQVSFHPSGEFMTCVYKENYKYDEVIDHIAKFALKQTNKRNSVGIG